MLEHVPCASKSARHLSFFATLRGLCRLYQARGALLTAREFGEQLLWLAQCEATPMHLLEAHGVLGATFFYLGKYATAWMHLKQGIAHSDPAAQQSQAFRHGVAPGVACLAGGTLTLWCLGYPVQAMRRCQEALAQAQAQAHPYSLAQAPIRGWGCGPSVFCGKRFAGEGSKSSAVRSCFGRVLVVFWSCGAAAQSRVLERGDCS